MKQQESQPSASALPRRRGRLALQALALTAVALVLGFASSNERVDAEDVLPTVHDEMTAGGELPAVELDEPTPALHRLREPAPPSAERREAYAADRAKSVLDLQLFSEAANVMLADGTGAELIDVNPGVHAWFVLRLAGAPGGPDAVYHLENPDPEGVEVRLETRGLVLRDAAGDTPCDLGPAGALLAAAHASGKTYAPLCGGRLYVRNPTVGRRTKLEIATDFLRDNVWGGESITTFVRSTLYQDRFLATSEVIAPRDPRAKLRPRPAGAPRRAAVDPRYEGSYLKTVELGLELDNDRAGEVLAGRWYAVREQPGVYFSALQPRLVAPEVIAAQKGRVNALDDVESAALVYMVAFDLARFDTGFALGTDHPRVGWSERVPEATRVASLPGPDGIDTVAPFVRTGRLSPAQGRRVAATFTGGFKRSHGAFKYNVLSRRNHGSHYGFVEQGAVLSKLQPGLATALVWDDGTVELKTWTADDDTRLGHVRHARQNGVPVLETEPATGETRPGALVTRWGEGNWSGSQDQRLRSLRAGLCLQEDGDARFLIYGYFSSATPSAMARGFQAYGCRYAMMLDMNALEHTYLAVYHRDDEALTASHLITGMNVLDESLDGRGLPRFVAFADNRDFFYLLRRDDDA